jgi:serine/threonine protein kinase
MSEQGANSKVYRLNEQLAIKVVKTDEESKNEVKRYIELDPRNTGILNFPVIYRSIECDACNDKKAGSKKCTLIVSELYDGSLFSIKKEFTKHRDYIVSMLIQVIFSCSRLESMGLVHGDLHTGNILYKNLNEDQELIYEIDGKDYTIKTYGKLWVLWDFGNMVEVGKTIQSTGVKAVDTVKTDIERLVSLLGLRNKGFEELANLIERDSTKCNDLLYLVGL